MKVPENDRTYVVNDEVLRRFESLADLLASAEIITQKPENILLN
jgi:hypothetical protein